MARGTPLYRIHRKERSVWWFSTDGDGRFDLVGLAGRGTCYCAEEPMGSFVEVFRDIALVHEADVRARVLTAIRLRGEVRLADCGARRARGFGITAAIHSTENYALTQAWAEAFARAGFGGIRYLVSHDPAQRLTGVALFGPAGLARFPQGHSGAIPVHVVERCQRAFNIRVLPGP